MVTCRDYRTRHIKGSTKIYFINEASRKYLYVSWRDSLYTDENCKGCPFLGHREVSFTYHKDDQSVWEVVGVKYFLKIKSGCHICSW